MQDQRNIILWTAIALYAASIVTCIVAVVRARKDRVPWMGPESAAYLNPLANLFLGAGFLISALANNALWLRALFCAAGLAKRSHSSLSRAAKRTRSLRRRKKSAR